MSAVRGHRTLSHAALRPAAESVRLVFDTASVGMAQADPATGVLLQVNEPLARMLGWRVEEMAGRPFLDLTHPDDRAANWDAFQRMARGHLPAFDIEKRLLHKDGHAVWVLMGVTLIRDADKQPVQALAIVMDISQRKCAEQALAESEHRLNLALDSARLGLWEWHLDTGRLDVSENYLRITGLPASVSQRRIEEARALVHRDDVEAIWACDAAARAGQPFQAEFRICRADGEVRWVADHARCVCDAEGRPERMIGTLADITERKQIEETLRQARRQLEGRVHHRTEELALANASLLNEVAERQAAEEQVRELLQRLVEAGEEERRRLSTELHDSVGQHLAALSLGLKAIEIDPQVPQAARERLARLQQAVRKMDEDIDRLAHELRPAALDELGLEDALRDHAESWSRQTGLPVDIHTVGVAGQRFDHLLETTVYRVVQESLTNIHKHAGASRVGLIVERRGGELRTIIEDDGRGFEPARCEAERRSGPGGQLGLLGMAERAATAGGRLDIESSTGAGTTIYLTLPA